ncbi:MAG: class I SAM-dependent methyltransferase, partial [Candidatus Omnitrophica bacterium]|nr:class I SAM-dependent methyltransferase [Candidatus Omnitrophota bacterium]
DVCGLVQLKQSYRLNEMYGANYGYRSGLNRSMVEHLQEKARRILKIASPDAGDLIVDIGSNDSTLLQAYPKGRYRLAGIDPTGTKFREYYPKHIQLVPDFFSSKVFKSVFGGRKAKIVTSVAMFYDIEDPLAFMREIHGVLHDDGVWIFEQSYMPTMLDMNAYDTICHEHLEYYRLKQIKYMTDRAGFKIIDIEFNDVNGGSFSVMAAKSGSAFPECAALIHKVLRREQKMGLDLLAPYVKFRQRVYKHRAVLKARLRHIRSGKKLVLGYGASTKGNVILQFCNITGKDIPFIAEINEDKFGSYTPGTWIPIISEKEAKAMRPDYFMVLPWHFRENILSREKAFLKSGGKLLFPLPRITVQ